MIAECLRQLLDRKLITVREIEEATGRGNSTIYRWLENKSQPDINDYITMLQRLENKEVKTALIDAIICNLPVSIHWIDDGECGDVGDNSLSFVDDVRRCMTTTFKQLLNVIGVLDECNSTDRLSSSECAEISEALNRSISLHTHMKQRLAKQAGRRRKARPLQYATSV